MEPISIEAGRYYTRRDGKACKVYEVFERHVIGAYEYIPGTWFPIMLNRDGSWMSDKETGADIVYELNQCHHCGTTESPAWHEDTAGQVLCDECHDAWIDHALLHYGDG